MKALEEKILQEGEILPGEVLKVGSFLNQRMDVPFLMEMGREIAQLYANDNVEKVLTVEASGIALAVAVAAAIGVPAVFAKKNGSINMSGTMYCAHVHSYTHGTDNDIVVAADYLPAGERVLVVDDFLASGEALEGLISLVKQANATLVGCAVAIEKGFQNGGDNLRARGVRVESMAIVDSMSEDGITFRH